MRLPIRPVRIKTIRMGVDSTTISDIRSEKIYDACFVGRFHPQKGLSDLIEIWSRVCNEKKDAKLGLIGGGTGDWEELFRKKISECRSNGVEDDCTSIDGCSWE